MSAALTLVVVVLLALTTMKLVDFIHELPGVGTLGSLTPFIVAIGGAELLGLDLFTEIGISVDGRYAHWATGLVIVGATSLATAITGYLSGRSGGTTSVRKAA